MRASDKPPDLAFTHRTSSEFLPQRNISRNRLLPTITAASGLHGKYHSQQQRTPRGCLRCSDVKPAAPGWHYLTHAPLWNHAPLAGKGNRKASKMPHPLIGWQSLTQKCKQNSRTGSMSPVWVPQDANSLTRWDNGWLTCEPTEIS